MSYFNFSNPTFRSIRSNIASLQEQLKLTTLYTSKTFIRYTYAGGSHRPPPPQPPGLTLLASPLTLTIAVAALLRGRPVHFELVDRCTPEKLK
jgi:hypothetical protein